MHLVQFEIEIKYGSGKESVVALLLSRVPVSTFPPVLNLQHVTGRLIREKINSAHQSSTVCYPVAQMEFNQTCPRKKEPYRD